jgi:hypothetical protein
MEAYNLPIKLREWFVTRLSRQLKEESEAIKAASAGKKGAGSSQTLGAGNPPAQIPYTEPG